MGEYTVLVDLMVNYKIGKKTMLCFLDASICAPDVENHLHEAHSSGTVYRNGNRNRSMICVYEHWGQRCRQAMWLKPWGDGGR
ncbi:MAG TPA: hypothetical protein H9845_09610 [Candidatus Agathobaculum pullicola]|nr:hypothetical protein [Candidatus Agathobaculum pullicola]